jgi:hypothetical protein
MRINNIKTDNQIYYRIFTVVIPLFPYGTYFNKPVELADVLDKKVVTF